MRARAAELFVAAASGGGNGELSEYEMKSHYNKALKILLIISPVILSSCYSAEQMEITTKEMDAHLRIQNEVKEKMGFDIRSDYSGKLTGTMMFIDLIADKAMFDGGARDRDLILLSEENFYELIVFNQEKEIVIPIKRDNQIFNIAVTVPHLVLQDDPSKLHWYFHKHEE